MVWENLLNMPPMKFQCGHCGNIVASDKGYVQGGGQKRIYICPHCAKPTFFETYGPQIPGISPGNDVDHLPDELSSLYSDARACAAVGAFTAAVLTCRKLLMNIAVTQGAEEGRSFIHYVEYLAENGFVPPNGKAWVDHIRKKGNEANHEIRLMAENEAIELISFAEMLMKFIYEFPAKVPAGEQ